LVRKLVHRLLSDLFARYNPVIVPCGVYFSKNSLHCDFSISDAKRKKLHIAKKRGLRRNCPVAQKTSRDWSPVAIKYLMNIDISL
jgi:hypothetical protein